jgi:hypothetical protein
MRRWDAPNSALPHEAGGDVRSLCGRAGAWGVMGVGCPP